MHRAIGTEMLLLVFLFGLIIGSFLNVVIARLPEHRSLVWPGSRCPGCDAAIAWHDNIPVLSFLALRGRCRSCSMRIPWRYPLVEVSTAAMFGLTYEVYGLTPDFAVAILLESALIAITGIDLMHQLIPDAITIPGILAGFLATLAAGRLSILDSIVGIAVGGGIFLVIILVSRGGMGGGDMKLGAMLGAFLGWRLTLLSILIAVLLGGAFAVSLLVSGKRGRKDPIPFGPFLALGGSIAMVWGERLLTWYLDAFVR